MRSKIISIMTSAPIIVGLFLAAGFTQPQNISKSKRTKFLSPPENIKFFSLGYNDLMASSLWVRLLQDFEFCENGKFTEADFVPRLESEKDEIDKVIKRKMKPSKCHKGWVYDMIHAITEIEPHFKLAYETGAVLLSVVVDDREGARLIYEKGLKIYPNDWEMNFRAAYHYLWEIQDAQKAAIYFEKAARDTANAPDWVVALSAALFTKVGNARFAKIILEDALEKRPTGPGAERIKIRLAEVNKILQEKP